MAKQFRLCAAAVVFNNQGNVLLGNRIETETDAWQFPQGGIESGETPAEAAKRELKEETGVSLVELVYAEDMPVRYEFSENIKKTLNKRGIFNDGQDIYFVLFHYTGDNSDINIHTPQPEFKDYKWDSFDFAVKNIIGFKQDAYQQAYTRLTPVIRQYLDSIS